MANRTSIFLKFFVVSAVAGSVFGFVYFLDQRMKEPLYVDGVQLERCEPAYIAFFSDEKSAKRTLCEQKNSARLMFGEIDKRMQQKTPQEIAEERSRDKAAAQAIFDSAVKAMDEKEKTQEQKETAQQQESK